jgi:FkbM family methyltransferase
MDAATPAVFDCTMTVLDWMQRVYMRLLTYLTPVKECQTVFGATIYCHSRDFVQRRIRFFGIFEHNLTFFFMSQLRKGDVYVDLGANIGYYTLLASKLVGSTGRVISVEAAPTIFAALQQNLQINGCPNVTSLNVAATAKRCRVSIEAVDRHNSGTTEIRIDDNVGAVQGLPFREIVGEDIGRVRFIKIDVEGSEAPLLKAILGALSDLPEDLTVASEVSFASATFVKQFVEAGFRAYAIQNVYSIDYYLIRLYFRKYGEDQSVHIVPVTEFNPAYTDYIFERGPSSRRQPSV